MASEQGIFPPLNELAPENVRKWIERSQSLEYQSAYDQIAREIPLKQDQVVLEVASGPGEMIKRMFPRVKKIFAVEQSEHMLAYAQQNLLQNGIPAEIISPPTDKKEFESESQNPTVVLVNADFATPPFGDDWFNHCVLTFPNFETNRVTWLWGLAKRVRLATHGIMTNHIDYDSVESEMLLNMLFLTKTGGIMSIARHYSSRSESLDEVRSYFEPDLYMRKMRFFEEPKMATELVFDPIEPPSKFGYAIFVCGKKLRTEDIKARRRPFGTL